MQAVVLVIHLVLALAIIGLVLLQRSEGGGLGAAGGGMGGLTTAKGAANALTRATGICAAGFFATSLLLGMMAGAHRGTASVIDMMDQVPATETAAPAVPAADKPVVPPSTPAPPVSK